METLDLYIKGYFFCSDYKEKKDLRRYIGC